MPQTDEHPRKHPAARGRPRSLVSERAILDATTRVLRKDGYAGLTLDRVAALAKASKTTIYRRWPAKEYLVLAVLERIPPLLPVDRGNLLAELHEMHERAAPIVESDPMRQVLATLSGQAAVDPKLRESMRMFQEKRRLPLRIVLERAMSRGELPRGTNIDLAIDLIQGSMLLRGYLLGEPMTRDWMEMMFRTLIRGLGGKPRRA